MELLKHQLMDVHPPPEIFVQGSVLSSLLYLLFTADIKTTTYTEKALHADDTVLIISGKVTKSIVKKWKIVYQN